MYTSSNIKCNGKKSSMMYFDVSFDVLLCFRWIAGYNPFSETVVLNELFFIGNKYLGNQVMSTVPLRIIFVSV